MDSMNRIFFSLTTILIVWNGSFCRATIVHARIGQYKGVTDSQCGTGHISRLIGAPKGLEWHNMDEINERIINARDALIGELNFVVYIRIDRHFLKNSSFADSTCTGSILNTRWILTAAHCFRCDPTVFNCPPDVYVYPGLKSRADLSNTSLRIDAKPWYIHDNFTGHGYQYQGKDLALLKLTKPITFPKDRLAINAVCLPQRNIMNTGDEYVVIGGWGRVNRLGKSAQHLQKGWTKILGLNGTQWVVYNDMLLSTYVPHPGGSQTCKGDSGGPHVQYVNGRAVLIGVKKGFLNDKAGLGDKCSSPTKATLHLAVRVSVNIDWIINTIRSH